MKENNLDIINEYIQQVASTEVWTSMKFDKVIFDSEICSIEILESTFHKHVMNRNNLGLLIECVYDSCYPPKKIIIGFFIYSQITNYSIVDGNSFLFSFANNNPMKYEVKSMKKDKEIFHLYDHLNKKLWSIGNNAIVVNKDKTIQFNKNINSFFDFNWDGPFWKYQRLVVIQFAEEKE